ncbi:MAG: hypothetical protein ACRDUX_04455 [Mycobacterium sp.]
MTSTGADPGLDGLSVVRATARAVWDEMAEEVSVIIQPGDDVAWVALHRWALLPDAESRGGRVRSASSSTHPHPLRRQA